jgi:hypothetical protein
MVEEYCWAIAQAAGHAAVNQVPVYLSLDFNWTPLQQTQLTIRTLNSDLHKIQLPSNLPERKYGASR